MMFAFLLEFGVDSVVETCASIEPNFPRIYDIHAID